MRKKLYSVDVSGKNHNWSFDVMATQEMVEDWRNDGLTINRVIYRIPAWIVDIGLLRPYCFMQDVWHLRNPFRCVDGPTDNN